MLISDKPRFHIASPSMDVAAEISEEEFRHAKVLRLQSGDTVHVVDGVGKLFEGEIAMNKRSASIKINQIIRESDPPIAGIVLAVAPTKNIARFEWAIEKCTELGAIEIIPMLCENSERSRLKMDRLEKIIVSASKQSQRLWFPKINELTPFNEVLTYEAQYKYIAHCFNYKKRIVTDLLVAQNLVLIGPEGDFSAPEIESAIAAGFEALALGDNRLRTETAAVSICASYHLAHT